MCSISDNYSSPVVSREFKKEGNGVVWPQGNQSTTTKINSGKYTEKVQKAENNMFLCYFIFWG